MDISDLCEICYDSELEDGYYFDQTDWCPNGVYVEDGVTYGLTEEGEPDFDDPMMSLNSYLTEKILGE